MEWQARWWVPQISEDACDTVNAMCVTAITIQTQLLFLTFPVETCGVPWLHPVSGAAQCC